MKLISQKFPVCQINGFFNIHKITIERPFPNG